MRKSVFAAGAAILLGAMVFQAGRNKAHAAPATLADGPQFASDGSLIRPEGYRRTWVYLSSGFGMSYSAGTNPNPRFTNVFVDPAAYDYFVATGKWPERTMFVLEEYESTSHGSINKSGSYQQELAGVIAEVKDEKRFPDQWAYFAFGTDQKATQAIAPARNACWKCHEENAGVEHSFVQFYPELLKVARAKATLKPGVRVD